MQGEKRFYGWGRKKSGQMALKLAKKHNTSFVLLEDGFIRSLGLGVEGSPSFSIVEDDVGIYYDATTPSKLENILNSYNFQNDTKLMDRAQEAIKLIQKYNISKYNSAPNIKDEFFQDDKKKKVLIIAQTAGDASLEYGLGNSYSTDEMIDTAIEENPNATIYIKIHPDVLSGKKKSDIDIKALHSKCKIISEDVNPISLLQHFKKVYTKTSGMGFEALLSGCECVCFGMPYYAGWGLTDDRVECKRRKRLLRLEDVFAAAYILYTRYHNPYTDEDTDILGAIEAMVKMRN
jgi:capsular polysaccharide export protein